MVSCCVKHCGARKNKNQPELTLHRFPVKEILKKKWLEVIGSKNINPRHKNRYVCSLHFKETCFNKTLDVMRLRAGAVPSSSLLAPYKISKPVLFETQNIPESICPEKVETSNDNLNKNVLLLKIPNRSSKSVLHETLNIPESPCPIEVEMPDDNSNENALFLKIQQQNTKVKFLTKKCNLLKKKVHRTSDGCFHEAHPGAQPHDVNAKARHQSHRGCARHAAEWSRVNHHIGHSNKSLNVCSGVVYESKMSSCNTYCK